MAGVEHVQIDRGRVVHDVGVVLAGEDVAGAAHVGGELIDLVEAPIDDGATERLVAQIADDEIIGLGFGSIRGTSDRRRGPRIPPASIA